VSRYSYALPATLPVPNAPLSTNDCPITRIACRGAIAFEPGRANIIIPATLTCQKILMNSYNRYKETDLRQVVEKMALPLRLKTSEAAIEAVFAEFSLPPPSRAVTSYIRKMLDIETNKTTELLLKKLSAKFERPPKRNEVPLAFIEAGYPYTRDFRSRFMKMLKERNAERWASPPCIKKKIINLAEGELAMWNGLQKSYGVTSDALASTLLRLFVVVTATGKINPLEVPYLTSSIVSGDLKRYANSLNFEVKNIRKPRA
jgi:hypothetical protein